MDVCVRMCGFVVVRVCGCVDVSVCGCVGGLVGRCVILVCFPPLKLKGGCNLNTSNDLKWDRVSKK